MQPSADVRGTMLRFYGHIANRCPGPRRARPAVLETHTKNPALGRVLHSSRDEGGGARRV